MIIGSSVNAKLIKQSIDYATLLTNFDCLYTDSSFSRDGEIYEAAKLVSEFAMSQGKQLRGNRLIGRREYYWDRKQRIETILSLFPEVTDWDCVHELIQDNGQLRPNIQQNVIDECFYIAKDSKPEAKLFYCDYFRKEKKWEFCYEMITGMIDRGVPVDGISIQLNSTLQPPLFGLSELRLDCLKAEEWMLRFKQLGLIIHVPEVVVWQPKEGGLSEAEITNILSNSDICREILLKGCGEILLSAFDVQELQSKGYNRIISICKSVGCELIGFWSAFDTAPWNWVGNRDKAGFWDENFQEKPCLEALKSLKEGVN